MVDYIFSLDGVALDINVGDSHYHFRVLTTFVDTRYKTGHEKIRVWIDPQKGQSEADLYMAELKKNEIKFFYEPTLHTGWIEYPTIHKLIPTTVHVPFDSFEKLDILKAFINGEYRLPPIEDKKDWVESSQVISKIHETGKILMPRIQSFFKALAKTCTEFKAANPDLFKKDSQHD